MSVKLTIPRYAIHFYDYKWIHTDNEVQELKSVVLIDEVSKRLKESCQDILKVFRLWGEAGHPQEYFMATDTGQKSRGGSYEIGLHVWNYQGGHQGNKTDFPHSMGVLTRSRVWGNGYQQVGTGREEFYLGPLA